MYKYYENEPLTLVPLLNLFSFGTSIWDETLYKAWSEIVTNLIPNMSLLETHLNKFCSLCDAEEVVLFERATFLVISHATVDDHDDLDSVGASLAEEGETAIPEEDPADEESLDNNTNSKSLVSSTPKFRRTAHFDAHRFEKISNIVKQFKLSCGKAQYQFQGMQVQNSRFRAFIDAFTANTYIMVVVSNPAVRTQATERNIAQARPHFEKFIPRI